MLTGWRDFDDALKTLDILHRHFDHAFDPRWGGGRERVWRRVTRTAAWPAINVVETKEAFVYRAEVPGLGEGDVTVQVEDGSLLVRGERKSDAPKGYEAQLRERAALSFARKLPLPGRVDADAITATMKDGVLTVTLPKAKDSLPRQITVKAL